MAGIGEKGDNLYNSIGSNHNLSLFCTEITLKIQSRGIDSFIWKHHEIELAIANPCELTINIIQGLKSCPKQFIFLKVGDKINKLVYYKSCVLTVSFTSLIFA